MKNNYYLELKFKNARHFIDDRVDKSNPIDLHTIKNVIHVIFGKRPVNRKRYKNTDYGFVKYYEDKALNSFLSLTYQKIRELYPYSKPDGFINEVVPEYVTLNKSVPNSDVKLLPSASWDLIKSVLDDNEFYYFVNSVLKELLGYTPTDKPLWDVIKDCNKLMLTKENRDELYNKHKNIIKPIMLFSIFFEFKMKNVTNKLTNETTEELDLDNNTLASINLGKIRNKKYNNRPYGYSNLRTEPQKHIILNGVIYVPVNEIDIEVLRNLPGFCTILDGGIVRITNLINKKDLNTNYLINFNNEN